MTKQFPHIKNYPIHRRRSLTARAARTDLRYKSIATSTSDKVKVTNFNKKDSIIFKDKYGVRLKLSDNNILNFSSQSTADTNYIYAYKDTIPVGKLMLNTYAKKTYDIVLVSVNGAKLPNANEIKEYLDKVYHVANVEFNVLADTLTIRDLENFTHGGSGTFTVYNESQKKVLQAYDNRIKDKIQYLFFIENVTETEGVGGYNPLGYQCGFIYNGANNRTIAHEIGHGLFSLHHQFSDSKQAGKTDNLMDYSFEQDIELYHYQWDSIQEIQRKWLKWRQDEEEGESVEGFKWNLLSLSIQNNDSDNEIILKEDPISTIHNTNPNNKVQSFALLSNSEFKISIKFELDENIQDFEIIGQITDKKFIGDNKQNVILDRISCNKFIDNNEENKSTYYYIAEFLCPQKTSNYIDYFDKFTIDWKIKYNGKEFSLKTTKNRVMVLNKIVNIEIPLYETIVDIVCRNAQKKNTPYEIIDAIWTDFGNLQLKNINGDPLYYWLNGSSDGDDAQNINGLLGNHNGTCLAWAKLFYFILKSQGISSQVYQIQCCDEYNKKNNYSGLIATKAFKFGTMSETKLVNDFVYEVSYETGFVCSNSCNCAPGQNNKNPICYFKNHYVVVCDGILYDPSYGTKFVSNGEENIFELWENASIGAFLVQKGPNNTFYAKPNDKNIREIKFSKSVLKEEFND